MKNVLPILIGLIMVLWFAIWIGLLVTGPHTYIPAEVNCAK